MQENNVFVKLAPSFDPSKVVLLALVAAYCAGILPKKTNRPLLATIVKYIEGPSIHDDEMKSVSLPTLENLLDSIKTSCIKADPQDGPAFANDIELRVLHALWTLKSLDSMHTFITRAKSLLVDNLRQGKAMMKQIPENAVPTYLLTKSSFLGSFVLKSITAFESLEFTMTIELWEAFVDYREPSRLIWLKKDKTRKAPQSDLFGSSKIDDDPRLIQSISKRLHPNEGSVSQTTILISQEDLSELINYQVHIFETYGTPTLPEFRDVLKKMSHSESGRIPSTHYIEYLECLRSADYEGSFNALHRYFDYMMSNRQTVFYHYALLSLASLHASFNCDGEAIRAIQESISVARENKDTACLNFLLTWLFNFLKDRPNLKHDFYVSNDQLLQYLKSKTGESSTLLHSTAYQSDATQLMLEGASLPLILESLAKASYISLSVSNSPTSFISYCSLSSAFWFRAGNHHLSSLYNEIALNSSTSISQKVSILIRKAYLEFSDGNIKECFAILEEQEHLVHEDVHLSKELACHKSLLLAEMNITSSRYKNVEMSLKKIQAQEHVNLDIEGSLHYLLAKLNFKVGNVNTAFEIIADKLSNFAKRDTNRYWFIKFSLLNCELVSQSSSPSRTLSTVIQLLKLSSDCGYHLLILESVLLLCDILLKLEEISDACELIDEFLPKFALVPDIQLRSRAHKYLAKTLICKFQTFEYSENEKPGIVKKVVQALEFSVDGYKKISNLEEIQDCLQLQLKFGSFIDHQEMIEHASQSQSIIKEKLQEIATY